MKTNNKKTVTDFDAVKSIRVIKENIKKKNSGLNFEQLRNYLDKNKLHTSK